MHKVVLLRDWVCAQDHGDVVTFLDESSEVVDVRAGRVADYESRCQVYRLCSVLYHLLWDVLDVATWAASARGVADNLQWLIRWVAGEPPGSLPHRSQTFAPTAGSIAVTDDDAYLHIFPPALSIQKVLSSISDKHISLRLISRAINTRQDAHTPCAMSIVLAMALTSAYSASVMSLILAVRDDEDIVLASDGRVLDDDLGVISESSLKTLALNDAVCLGLAGPTYAMRQVLTSLGIKCRDAGPVDLLGLCQEVACPVEVDYRDACDEVSSVLRWMTRRVPSRQRLQRIPAVILAGKERELPSLSEWSSPTWRTKKSEAAGYFEAVVGSLPDAGSPARTKLHRMLRGELTTKDAENRLAKAVRFCANYFGAKGPINENVFVRRLSRGFELSHG